LRSDIVFPTRVGVFPSVDLTDTVEVSGRFVTAIAILGSQCCGDLIKDANKASTNNSPFRYLMRQAFVYNFNDPLLLHPQGLGLVRSLDHLLCMVCVRRLEVAPCDHLSLHGLRRNHWQGWLEGLA
jgi:hypothetical protein